MDIKDFKPLPGDMIAGCGKGFTAWLQKINGRANDGRYWTHGAEVTYPTGSSGQIDIVASAEINGNVHMRWNEVIEDPSYDIIVVRIKGVTKAETENALDYGDATFLNDSYGWKSWPWFGWKALWDRVINPIWIKVFGSKLHDVDLEDNWWTAGTFCTERIWWHLKKVIQVNPKRWNRLQEAIQKYFPNTFQPIQWRNLMMSEDFEIVMQRLDGIVTIF